MLKVTGYSFLVILLLIGAGLTKAKTSPDFDLHFHRDALSPLPLTDLQNALSHPYRWKKWFHTTTQVKLVSTPEHTDVLAQNQSYELTIDPGKGPSKIFTLTVWVKEFIPNQKLVLQLTHDSTGRMTQLFDPLIWTMEIMGPAPSKLSKPGKLGKPDKILLRQTVQARAISLRSKFFGLFADQILLYQVTYPDVLRLADLNRVDVKNPFEMAPTR